MTLFSLLGSLKTADWFLGLMTQSLALLLAGWVLAKLTRRISSPLKSGIQLALMVLLVLLPPGILVFKTNRLALYRFPISPGARDVMARQDADGRSLPGADEVGKARELQAQTASADRRFPMGRPSLVAGLRSTHPLLLFLNGFGLVWMAGFVFFLGRLLWGMAFLSGFKRSLTKFPDEDLAGILHAVQSAFPGTRLPAVMVSPAIDSPAVFGVRHPVIVLPGGLGEKLTLEELQNILIHETGHIRHRDHWSGFLQRWLTSFYWWNPLAYALSTGFSLAREDVSDNYAIQNSGARAYASCLVALAGKTNLIPRLPAAVGMATRHLSLEDRVKNIISKERIMETKMKRPWTLLIALAAVLLAALVVRYSWSLSAADVGVEAFVLPSGVDPQALAVDKDRIYLCEYENFPQKPESHIAVHSKLDFSLLAKIGRIGKGPGEFLAFGPSRFLLANDQIWALDMRKTIVFSRDGVFQKEIPIPREIFAPLYPLVPIGDKFVSLAGDWPDISKGNLRVFGRLYGSDLRMIKEFYGEMPLPVPPPPPPPPPPPGRAAEAKSDRDALARKEYQAIPDCLDFAVAEGKIFVADTRKGFHIAVFDSLGVPLYEIHQDEAPIPVPREYASALQKKLDETQGWLRQVAEIKFRDSFPAFYGFKIADGKIYLPTYAEKDGLHELVILDLEGHVLKRSFSFPLGPSYDVMYNNFNVVKDQYAISEGKIYFLAKSPKGGSSEVRIQELK